MGNLLLRRRVCDQDDRDECATKMVEKRCGNAGCVSTTDLYIRFDREEQDWRISVIKRWSHCSFKMHPRPYRYCTGRLKYYSSGALVPNNNTTRATASWGEGWILSSASTRLTFQNCVFFTGGPCSHVFADFKTQKPFFYFGPLFTAYCFLASTDR